MASCNPQELLDASNCFGCLNAYQLSLVQASLLCRIYQASNPMASCSPQDLLNSASCFQCLNGYQLLLVSTQLLCEILNAGGAGGQGCLLCSANSDPVDPPSCDCALFYRRDNMNVWLWNSGTAAWVLTLGG